MMRQAFQLEAMRRSSRQSAFPPWRMNETNPFTKAQVADRIRKVEEGVDQFQKYLENRGEGAGAIGTKQWRNNAPAAFGFRKH